VRRAPAVEIPKLQAKGSDPSSWIKQRDKALAFHTTGQLRDVALAPLNSIFDRRYNVYWEVS
jgi:hypothetical protein